MATPDIVLYHHPGACSQVTIYALEKAGAAYRLELVNLIKGQQTTPEYLALNPLGKVPLLLMDGKPLMENSAIITLIGTLWPDAGIFPKDLSPWTRAEVVGGLSFCSGTLHPLIRGMANPQRMTTGDGEPVREMSRKVLTKAMIYAEQRMAERGWWIEEPSVVDVYLNWALSIARFAGYDLAPYPRLDQLSERLMADPAFARMQAQEAELKQRVAA